jgi:Nif-specific regulatory protein
VARALHRFSARNQQPFVKLNCAALPESLLESELFGHERGAFTGAVKTRRGRFELADHGTLFLDEIGDISLATQIKLLRVLQERTFERVGGSRSLSVDVRIIAASNADLEEAVRTRRFREDLYYRLHVVPIVLPPLRERREDIPLLVGHFLQRFNAENRKALKLSSPAMDLLVGYDWPGNVRELENCIERMVVMARREVIAPEDVPLPISIYAPTPPPRVLFPEPTASTLPKAVADIERERLLEALRRSGGVQTRAATLLGIRPARGPAQSTARSQDGTGLTLSSALKGESCYDRINQNEVRRAAPFTQGGPTWPWNATWRSSNGSTCWASMRPISANTTALAGRPSAPRKCLWPPLPSARAASS